MSVITNVTVPVGNWTAEPAVVGTGSEVGLEIGIADINPAGRGGERLDGQAKARGGVPALSTGGSISSGTCPATSTKAPSRYSTPPATLDPSPRLQPAISHQNPLESPPFDRALSHAAG
jgi:hypothetical protein